MPAPICEEVGLRNAVVVLEYAGRSTEWHVPSLAVELTHGLDAQRHLGQGDDRRRARDPGSSRSRRMSRSARARSISRRRCAISFRAASPPPCRSSACCRPSTCRSPAMRRWRCRATAISAPRRWRSRSGTAACGFRRCPRRRWRSTADPSMSPTTAPPSGSCMSPSTLRWRGSRITHVGHARERGRARRASGLELRAQRERRRVCRRGVRACRPSR